MDGGGTEQGRYSFCGFLPCNPRQLDLTAEELIPQVKRSPLTSRWQAARRFPMASTTLTVTPLPACLYSCASD